jgi:L-malate glycosyltransferase
MGSALPVVATDVGDVRTILPEEQSEFVIPVQERESAWPLADKLSELLADRERRELLGGRNRARVHERFTFEAMRAAHAEVWRSGLSA